MLNSTKSTRDLNSAPLITWQLTCNADCHLVFVSLLAEWYWKCWGYQLCLGLSAVIMGVLSTMVMWSECLFFVRSPTLSLFAVLVNVAKMSYNYRAIEVKSRQRLQLQLSTVD